jgi:CRP-like cAMP-binding protein
VQPEVPIQTWAFDIDPDDTFLLCSAGIYNYFPQDTGLCDLMGDTDLERGLSAIIDTALERGGHDNCTGILLRLAPSPQPLGAPIAVCVEQMDTWPLFAPLTALERLMVLGVSERQHYSAHTPIAEAGAMMDGLLLVVAGSLQLRRGEQVVRTISAGQAIGQHALLGPVTQPDALFAAADTHVVRLTHQAFKHLTRQDPEIGSKLLGALMRYVGAASPAAAQPGAHTF